MFCHGVLTATESKLEHPPPSQHVSHPYSYVLKKNNQQRPISATQLHMAAGQPLEFTGGNKHSPQYLFCLPQKPPTTNSFSGLLRATLVFWLA